MRANEFLKEGDVVQHKFGAKQAQKGKDKYKYNAEMAADIPMFDRAGMQNIPSSVEYPDHMTAKFKPEPYDHFEARPTGSGKAAHIMGITSDGYEVQTSTSTLEVAQALADMYNRGGFTDKEMRKIPLGGKD